ncbi:hypothetical protein V1525DRAFT_392065, partial [Lipomyces kononenkoae]
MPPMTNDLAVLISENDIQVEVKASAVNFRDIAVSMTIIDDYQLGDECSRIVRLIGKNVNPSQLQPVDQVLASRPGQGAHQSI